MVAWNVYFVNTHYRYVIRTRELRECAGYRQFEGDIEIDRTSGARFEAQVQAVAPEYGW
jgi:hypothetical protein